MSCKLVLKMSWKMKKYYTEDVLKKSSRCLGKQEIFARVESLLTQLLTHCSIVMLIYTPGKHEET